MGSAFFQNLYAVPSKLLLQGNTNTRVLQFSEPTLGAANAETTVAWGANKFLNPLLFVNIDSARYNFAGNVFPESI